MRVEQDAAQFVRVAEAECVAGAEFCQQRSGGRGRPRSGGGGRRTCSRRTWIWGPSSSSSRSSSTAQRSSRPTSAPRRARHSCIRFYLYLCVNFERSVELIFIEIIVDRTAIFKANLRAKKRAPYCYPISSCILFLAQLGCGLPAASPARPPSRTYRSFPSLVARTFNLQEPAKLGAKLELLTSAFLTSTSGARKAGRERLPRVVQRRRAPLLRNSQGVPHARAPASS